MTALTIAPSRLWLCIVATRRPNWHRLAVIATTEGQRYGGGGYFVQRGRRHHGVGESQP